MPFLYALPAFPVAQMLLATPEDWCYIEEKEGITMYENLDGIHRPLYKNLWTYWLMMLVALGCRLSLTILLRCWSRLR